MNYLRSVSEYKSIIRDPDNIKISRNQIDRISNTLALALEVTPDTIAPASRYMNRLPKDLQIVFWMLAIQNHDFLLNHPILNKWLINNARLFA